MLGYYEPLSGNATYQEFQSLSGELEPQSIQVQTRMAMNRFGGHTPTNTSILISSCFVAWFETVITPITDWNPSKLS